jgi:hypothetical protein
VNLLKIDFEQLTKDLSEDELSYLEGFRHHIMNFKYIADECGSWDDIINTLQAHIEFIKKLKTQGAEISNFDNHILFYELPDEHSVFATLTAIQTDTYEFQLADGTRLTTPITKADTISPDRIGTQLVLLITEHGEVCEYVITHDMHLL